MLFHQHGQAVQNDKHGVRPGPITMVGPPDGNTQVCSLPTLQNIYILISK